MLPPLEPVPSTCPTCGWTAEQLRNTGRMGCAACYTAFAAMVAQAAREVHGSSESATDLPAEVTLAYPTKPADTALPWPTRRAHKRG